MARGQVQSLLAHLDREGPATSVIVAADLNSHYAAFPLEVADNCHVGARGAVVDPSPATHTRASVRSVQDMKLPFAL